MRYLLVSLLFLVSCASLQTENNLSHFNKAKKMNLAGEKDKAQALWTELCQKKHKASCVMSGQKVNWHPHLAIMQASTDQESTNLVFVKRKSENHQFFLFDPEDKKVFESAKTKDTSRKHSSWSIVQVEYNNLQSNKEYHFVVVSEFGELLDFRKLKTLNSDKKRLKWALTSCMADYYDEEQKRQWQDVASFNSDVLFMIGDNVYVDWGRKKNVTPSFIWDRHVQTRNKLEVFRQQNLVPVFATWDDHDYGLNNSGLNFPYKKESKDIFKHFFPMTKNKVVISQGPGVAAAVQLSDQLFLFLDDRYFRTPTEDKKNQSHFGQEQVKWAMDLINKSKSPIWLISGDQFFGGYHPFESFQGNHPDDFKNFLSLLRKSKKKVAFLSGDRHLSEIMNIPKKYLGYKTYELTSSGIHSTTYPGSFKKTPNPLTKLYVDGVINYMIIESENSKKGLDVHVKDYGTEKSLLFEKRLLVQ